MRARENGSSGRRSTRCFGAAVAAAIAVSALGVPSGLAAPASGGEPTTVGREPIVGGSEVDPPGAYPFMVGLITVEPGFDFPICGGALVSPTWVVTAAHCLKVDVDTPEVAADISVVVGRHELENGATGERIQAARLIPHPEWRDVGGDDIRNDIALIELATPATLGGTIQLALPGDAAMWAAGQEGTVLGWGAQNPDGTNPSPVLREVDVPHRADSACSGAGYDPALSLCAGGIAGEDSCSGDSGGPLIASPDDEPYMLVGIVSSGPDPCGQEEAPAVYTEVAAFVDWLEENTGLDLSPVRQVSQISGAASAVQLAERLGPSTG